MAVEITEGMDSFGNPTLAIQDPEKSKNTYTVVKSNDGFAFYQVVTDVGKVPKVLSSLYTKQSEAEKAVVFFLNTRPKSQTVKREENTKAILAQKEANSK